MKVPNAHLATIPEQKIKEYLLNPGHPVGGGKAAFFLRFGFRASEWRQMAAALLTHVYENEVSESSETQYGIRYAVEGLLRAPDGTPLNIRSAWYIDRGGNVPRFVTAHPLPKL